MRAKVSDSIVTANNRLGYNRLGALSREENGDSDHILRLL